MLQIFLRRVSRFLLLYERYEEIIKIEDLHRMKNTSPNHYIPRDISQLDLGGSYSGDRESHFIYTSECDYYRSDTQTGSHMNHNDNASILKRKRQPLKHEVNSDTDELRPMSAHDSSLNMRPMSAHDSSSLDNNMEDPSIRLSDNIKSSEGNMNMLLFQKVLEMENLCHRLLQNESARAGSHVTIYNDLYYLEWKLLSQIIDRVCFIVYLCVLITAHVLFYPKPSL